MSDLGGFSMFDLFREEAETHCASLEAGLLQLESDPGDSNVAIEPLMRAAHSVKGAARIIGLDVAVGLAHAMEDVFVAVQGGNEALSAGRVDQLLAGTDLLRGLASIEESAIEPWSAENESAINALVDSLGKAADAVADAAHTQPPASGPVDVTTSPEPPEVAKASASLDPPETAKASTSPEPPETPRSSETPAATVSDEPPAPNAVSGSPGEESRTVRVDSGRLERMMRLAGEVMVTSRRFLGVREQVVGLDRRLESMEDGVGAAFRDAGDPLPKLRRDVDEGRRAVSELVEELDGLTARKRHPSNTHQTPLYAGLAGAGG